MAETPAPEPAETTTPTPEPEANPGDRDNPLALGETRLVSSSSAFEVGVTASNLDAAQSILAADPYAAPPAEGQSFVVATVAITVHGDAAEAQGIDLESEGVAAGFAVSVEYVSASGVAYGEYGNAGTCYTQNMLISAPSVFADGQSISGDACIVMPSEDVAGGLWRISNSMNDGVWISSS